MPRPRRKLITGWRIFFAAVLSIFALSYLDEREASSAPLTAFLPENTDWVVSSWDFPRAWYAVLHSDAQSRMSKEWSNPIATFELDTRLATGIRPTPARWRIWLGERTVFAHAADGWGLFTYPGFATRWADALRRHLGYGPDSDGISRYRNFYYTWRSGYLIASHSRAFVLAAVKSTGAKRIRSDSDALLTVQWEGEYEGWMHLRRGPGLPVDGQLHLACSDGERPLTLPQAWPEQPLLTVTTRSSADLQALWHALEGSISNGPWYDAAKLRVRSLTAMWGIRIPANAWDTGAGELSLALLNINAKGDVPLPSLAASLRYSELVPDASPFQFLLRDRQTLPFTWNGCPGAMTPLLGAEFSPCVAKCTHDWIATTSEQSMASIAGKLADGPACAADVDLAIRMSWEKFGKAADALTLKLGEWEVLPRMNASDVQADLQPKLKAIGLLGQLRLDGIAHNGTLKFSGALAQAETTAR